MKKILIKNKDEMANLARKIANSAQVGDAIILSGTLGAGKSFFAENFINSLNDKKLNVPSPTFNLVHAYDSKKGQIFHFDLYRLKNADELENIGFFDAIQSGICLIEWPDIALKFLKNYLEIKIKILEGDEREVFIN